MELFVDLLALLDCRLHTMQLPVAHFLRFLRSLIIHVARLHDLLRLVRREVHLGVLDFLLGVKTLRHFILVLRVKRGLVDFILKVVCKLC